MTTKPSKQDYELLTYYVNKSGRQLNRYKAAWAARSLREDFNDDELRAGIDFFIQTDPFPTWDRFIYKVSDILTAARLDVEDRTRRQRQREATQKLVEADAQS